jgi:tellurite resistance protein TehA-like permease
VGVIMGEPDQIPSGSLPSLWIRNFFPGYFALVMATGIVSLAWHFQGFSTIAKVLFWFNVPAYCVLWAITLVRLARFREEMVRDLTSHARGATFLTSVAATCVLGKQFVVLVSAAAVGKWLWVLALLLWVFLIYTFFTAMTVVEPKPRLETAINGSWLLVVVATESLCTLGTMVAPSFSRPDLVLFVSLVAYVLGAMFYIILITLIVYRWFFRSMEASMLTPPYWINMGALAITTLAGARLLAAAKSGPILERFQPFVAGFTIFFWATATWWIPLLIVVGIWRHLLQRVPLRYDPQYWSLVFPLGMYSVATSVLADVAGLPFLRPAPAVFAVAGLGAWVITLYGLVAQGARGFR